MVNRDHNSRATRCKSTRASTPDERAEFIELLQMLGAGAIRPDRDEQTVRCWNGNGHAHGDRNPSLSIKPSRSVFHCHGCGLHGGLVDLRQHAGRQSTQRSATRHRASTEQLRQLASPGADVISMIPSAAIEQLRERTGRHRRDHVLNRNLRTMIAAALHNIDIEQSTRNVAFGQNDALRCGIRPQLWSDLLELLPHIGLRVTRGQSGRCLHHRLNPRGRNGALAVTLVSYNPRSTHHAPHRADISRVIRLRPESTIAAALATKSTPADGPTLSRSPALADLLTLFGHYRTTRVATGGTGGDTIVDTLTISDLVAINGKRVRRTLRRAELLGLVSVMRPTTKRGAVSRYHGLVALTDLGIDVLERDTANGRERMHELATRAEQVWAQYLDRLAATDASDVFTIDDTTGEIVATRPQSVAPLRPSDGSTVRGTDAQPWGVGTQRRTRWRSLSMTDDRRNLTEMEATR